MTTIYALARRYNKNVKAVPSFGPKRSSRTRAIALACAAVMTAMLVAQLFSYDNFPSVLAVVLPFTSQPLIDSSAACVVIAELLTLPYLLGMYLTTLMRIASATLAVAVTGFWLLTALTNAHAQNSGLLSTTLVIQGGILPVSITAILAGLVAAVLVADSRFRHDASS